jgi:hypothetical protein
MQSEDRKFLLTEQVARRWQISPRTLERWRYERKGPPWVVVVGRILYKLAAIEAFEASGVRNPGAAEPKGLPSSKKSRVR